MRLITGVSCLWLACAAVPISPAAYSWLENKTQEFLVACQLTGVGGVQLFTPDASSSYGAQWTRDFEMALVNAPGVFKAIEANVSAAVSIRRCLARITCTLSATHAQVAYTLDRVTSDGMVPDRVQSNGVSMFAPGGPGAWPIMLAWDNMPFAGLLLAAYAREWNDTTFFCTYEPVARRALAFVPTDTGLAFNNPAAPNCSFGFEDSVTMPGRMLTVSLLLYDAASQLADLARATGCGEVGFYTQLAAGVAGSVDSLFDTAGTSGLFLASDGIENVPDVFGSAYLVKLGLSTPARRLSVAAFLAGQWHNSTRPEAVTTTVFQEGQARHLPYPDVWKRCWGGGCPSPGTYQNGEPDKGDGGLSNGAVCHAAHCLQGPFGQRHWIGSSQLWPRMGMRPRLLPSRLLQCRRFRAAA